MKRILIVDSDMAVRGQIGRHARLEGYEVAEAGDGYTAVSMCRQNAFDIIILAILLPEMDGFSVCQTIRSFSQVPILMLTERTSEQDRIHGLELGADDYMTKPFSPRELMLRISAILKRGKSLDSLEPQSIERDGIYIDLTARRVHVDGTLVSFKTHQISPAVRQALQALRERGIKLFLSTGRHLAMLDPVRQVFDFDGYVLSLIHI